MDKIITDTIFIFVKNGIPLFNIFSLNLNKIPQNNNIINTYVMLLTTYSSL